MGRGCSWEHPWGKCSLDSNELQRLNSSSQEVTVIKSEISDATVSTREENS